MTESIDGIPTRPGLGAPAIPAQPAVARPRPLVERIPVPSQVRMVLAAAAAGLIGQLLVVGQSVGINLLLWVVLVLATAWLLRRPTARVDGLDLWLPVAALALAGFPALRSDATLIPFDTLAAGGLTLASVVAIGGTPVTRRTWAGVTRLALIALGLALSGALELGQGMAPMWASVRVSRESNVRRVARGLLLALPLLIVFAVLFAAADAVFATYLRSAIGTQIAWDEVIARAMVAGVAAWLFAGTLVATWLSREAVPAAEATEIGGRRGRLGTIEAVVVLVVLDAVFGLFVVLQAAYLFGGLDTLAVTGMTYSEYARRGFFELVAVAVLAGAVILALDAAVVERSWPFRLAAAALAVLTGAVLLSAFVRLGLYQQAYGWTELRFFTLAGISWLAVGVVAALAGVLLERASLVPRVMVGAGLVIALVVNGIGPQAFVGSQNIARATNPALVPAGGESGLDVSYLGMLGDDVVPLLVAAVPTLPEAERRQVEAGLRARASELAREEQQLGWPSWNLGRQRALEALHAAGY